MAKLPYHWALDGISNTQTINPDALGHSEGERVENLVQVMDGYFDQGAHHLNVNVFGTEKLIDAMEHPEKEEYANFTIRVSGYAIKFIDLTREQQTITYVDARPMLDGGIVDSIPVLRAMSRGYETNIVVQHQPRRYGQTTFL